MKWRKIRFLVDFALESVGILTYEVGEYGEMFCVTGKRGRTVQFRFIGPLLSVVCEDLGFKSQPMPMSKALALMTGIILSEEIESAIADEIEENMGMQSI